MKALVAIKRVIDYNVQVCIDDTQTDVVYDDVTMQINPFCEIAIEEAVRLKEKGIVTEVVAVSIGNDKTQEQLRSAIALGCDRILHIKTDDKVQPLQVAKLLKAVAEDEKADLIILGKQAIDYDNNQTGQMLAALMGVGQATFASQVEVIENQVQVTREIDGGMQVVKLPLPAIITTDLRLNEPRFAKLPDIMRARKQEIEVARPDDYGIATDSNIKLVKLEYPKPRKAGVTVASVEELVDKLQNEANVI